jgi:hypothetical protein
VPCNRWHVDGSVYVLGDGDVLPVREGGVEAVRDDPRDVRLWDTVGGEM